MHEWGMCVFFWGGRRGKREKKKGEMGEDNAELLAASGSV